MLGHSIFDDQAIIDVWCDHYLTAKMTGARTVWFGVSWSDKAALARAFGPSLTRLKPDHVMGSRDATDSYNHVHLKKPKPFNSSLLDCWHKDRFYWFGHDCHLRQITAAWHAPLFQRRSQRPPCLKGPWGRSTRR